MSKLIESATIIDNFTTMLNKFLKSEMPEKGEHWELVIDMHNLTLNKLLHISQAIEQGKGRI